MRILFNTLTGANKAYGTYLRPFGADSPWNQRPVEYTLGASECVNVSDYYPTVAQGGYSVSAFLALPTDGPMNVYGTNGRNTNSLDIQDEETFKDFVTIPSFPASVTPANGSDGHCDIFDVARNLLHSFWQMRRSTDGLDWIAALYTVTPIDGRGWGNSAQYYQGARAAAVPPTGGVIRIHEVDDIYPYYRHALCCSLTFNSLGPGYVFPATSSDVDSAYANSGTVDEGSLLMLPQDFVLPLTSDARTNVLLAKVVATLKRYGMYVVDRNTGTPFVIYVETGSDFSIIGDYNPLIAIQHALRLATVTTFESGTGKQGPLPRKFNLLSMRGTWTLDSGPTLGVFDTTTQSVIFPENGIQTSQHQALKPFPQIGWATPAVGAPVKFSVKSTGGATCGFNLGQGNVTLGNGQSSTFAWSADATHYGAFTVTTGPNGGGSVVATLIEQ